jgi:hypothetical protein
MFYSYTGSEHKNMLVRVSTQNKCSKFLLILSQSFITEKRHGAMQKFGKKRKKMDTKMFEVFKTMGT